MITTRRPGLRGLAAAAAAAIPAAILALTPAPDGARAQEFTFKLHHFLSAQAPAHSRMLVPWAEQVEENSGGRVKIEIFPAMTLGGRPPELINQVRDGVVDLVWTVNGYTPGLFPRTEVFELPNVFTNDPRAADLAMNEMLASGALDKQIRVWNAGLFDCRRPSAAARSRESPAARVRSPTSATCA